MKNRRIVPMLESLDRRDVPSAHVSHELFLFRPRIPVFRPPAFRQPVIPVTPVTPLIPVDTSIHFVVAPPGVSQSSINFTTRRALTVVTGPRGLYATIALYANTGNTLRFNNAMARLAVQVPYGRSELLPIWQQDITVTLAVGGDVGAAQQAAFNDLADYVSSSVGVTMNYLETRGDAINILPVPVNGIV